MIESFLIRKTTKSCSEWARIEWLTMKAGVPQGPILGPLFFFYIYINDLSDNLESNVKLFADGTSMFSVLRDGINTSPELNNDHDRVSLWANKWITSLNPDPSKQAQDVIFSRKRN